MVWTEATRRQYPRDRLRYTSNLTDAEWALIEPFMPAARRIPAHRGRSQSSGASQPRIPRPDSGPQAIAKKRRTDVFNFLDISPIKDDYPQRGTGFVRIAP